MLEVMVRTQATSTTVMSVMLIRDDGGGDGAGCNYGDGGEDAADNDEW